MSTWKDHFHPVSIYNFSVLQYNIWVALIMLTKNKLKMTRVCHYATTQEKCHPEACRSIFDSKARPQSSCRAKPRHLVFTAPKPSGTIFSRTAHTLAMNSNEITDFKEFYLWAQEEFAWPSNVLKKCSHRLSHKVNWHYCHSEACRRILDP